MWALPHITIEVENLTHQSHSEPWPLSNQKIILTVDEIMSVNSSWSCKLESQDKNMKEPSDRIFHDLFKFLLPIHIFGIIWLVITTIITEEVK